MPLVVADVLDVDFVPNSELDLVVLALGADAAASEETVCSVACAGGGTGGTPAKSKKVFGRGSKLQNNNLLVQLDLRLTSRHSLNPKELHGQCFPRTSRQLRR
jgi:hypothetical protein